MDYNFVTSVFDLFQVDNTKYEIFVETGTLYGETISNMVNSFNELYTIEVSEDLHARFNRSNYNRDKINSILGDSSEILKNLVPNLTKNTVFYLDGHYSSGETAKGAKDVPLIEELDCINDYFKHEALIIVDDVRLFGTTTYEDWGEISKEKLLSRVSKRLVSFAEQSDRFIMKLKEILY